MANMGHTRLVLLAPGHGDENDDIVHVDDDCDDDDGVDGDNDDGVDNDNDCDDNDHHHTEPSLLAVSHDDEPELRETFPEQVAISVISK